MKESINILERIGRLGASGAQLTESERTNLDLEIDHLVASIATFATVSDAQSALDELDDLQVLLAKLAFKFHVPLTPKQRAVVRRFDRPDDPAERLRVFQEAKEGKFLCAGID